MYDLEITQISNYCNHAIIYIVHYFDTTFFSKSSSIPQISEIFGMKNALISTIWELCLFKIILQYNNSKLKVSVKKERS